jgi:HK97 family phage major capsid protein
MRKVAEGFRNAVSASIIGGDGLGKPLGILNPGAGIPILDTSPSTPEGVCTWQDLLMLKFELPISWHGGASWYMNQRTWALLASMSDAIGRPLWSQPPGGLPGLWLLGSPVNIVTQFPDCLPGNCPILFANLKQLYITVVRSAMSLQPDPYTAQWCQLFRFEQRIGGGIACPNAGRLLRIK